MPDYSVLDQPVLRELLFYPRRDHTLPPPGVIDLPVPVDDAATITCRIFQNDAAWPWLMYFHGNGEVVSDYDYIAPFYHACSINLVVADYRGYGASNGSPGFARLIRDAHTLFKALQKHIRQNSPNTRLYIMGRSLGSTSALELAEHYQEDISGLIIESGFLSVTRLIRHLQIPAGSIDLDDLESQCLKSLNLINCPALIIHGEYDTLVPLREGRLIYENLGSHDKNFVLIPLADHNDIIFARPELYFTSIQNFVHRE